MPSKLTFQSPRPPGSAASPPASHRRAARSVDLAAVVGHRDLDDPLFTGSLFAAAIDELALATGRDWHLDPGTPTVYLLRVLARISVHDPHVRSPSAQVLIDACVNTAGGATCRP